MTNKPNPAKVGSVQPKEGYVTGSGHGQGVKATTVGRSENARVTKRWEKFTSKQTSTFNERTLTNAKTATP